MTAFGLRTDSLRADGNSYGFIESTQAFMKHRESMSRAEYWAIIWFPRVMKYLFGKTISAEQDFFAKSCKDIATNRTANKINRSDYIQLLQNLSNQNDESDDESSKSMKSVSNRVYFAKSFSIFISMKR